MQVLTKVITALNQQAQNRIPKKGKTIDERKKVLGKHEKKRNARKGKGVIP
jgi:hypothetical protein